MKVRRLISGLLLGAGCALTFAGFLALSLPVVPNMQLQLVPDSFKSPSNHLFGQLVNNGINYTLEHAWQVTIVGALILLLGGILFGFFCSPRDECENEAYRRPAGETPPQSVQKSHVEKTPAPLWKNPEDEENPFRSYAPEDFAPAQPQTASPVYMMDEPLTYEPYVRPEAQETAAQLNTVSVFSAPRYALELQRESLAVETISGEYSQSGTKTILRPEPPVEEPAPHPFVPLQAPPAHTAIADEAPQQPAAAASSRIRSTMGKHRNW